MHRLALALICGLLSCPLWAAPARVISGEHDGFTRLVVELGAEAVWQFGRSEDGYELRLQGPPRDFDLTAVFNAIGRTRLAAIRTDEGSGVLRISIACSCYAAPFEFRPGTVVIDLKDGPPPKDSAYELPLDPALAVTAAASPAPAKHGAMSYAWADRALGLATRTDPFQGAAILMQPAPEPRPMPEPEPEPALASTSSSIAEASRQALPDPGLAPLRDALMREISLGAAQGVVDMHLPDAPTEPAPAEPKAEMAPDQARVGLNDLAALPQMRVVRPNDDKTSLGAEGAECPSDVQLDLASWGDDRPVWEQISESRNNLTGEFDRPNPEALRKAVQFHLFIAFGAEARDLLRAYPDLDPDAPLWSSLAYVLDDQMDPAPAFAEFGTCDSPAALWAMLSNPMPESSDWNVIAVQRSFSTLPLHLRQLLGPRLVEILASLGEDKAIPVITNAIRRAGGEEDRGVQLMEAEMAADAGDQQAADALLGALIKDPGPESAYATVALIEGKAARGMPVSEKAVTELEALVVEYDASPDGPRFQKALVLARALSGDFARAFSEARDDSDLRADLWRLLAALGNDDLVLELATLPEGSSAPPDGQKVAADLADRFLTLGLPAQAVLWLSSAPQADPLLAARVAIAQHDGRSAIAYLSGLEGEDAFALRVKALIMTGDDAQAAMEMTRAGDLSGATSALARARDWTALQEKGQTEWLTAAKALSPGSPEAAGATPDVAPPGPLAEGANLVAQALATREALTALLASVPAPKKSTN